MLLRTVFDTVPRLSLFFISLFQVFSFLFSPRKLLLFEIPLSTRRSQSSSLWVLPCVPGTSQWCVEYFSSFIYSGCIGIFPWSDLKSIFNIKLTAAYC